MGSAFSLALVLVAAQQSTPGYPNASRPVATPPQTRLRSTTLLTIKEGIVSSVAYSPDGKTLAGAYFKVRGVATDDGVPPWELDGVLTVE